VLTSKKGVTGLCSLLELKRREGQEIILKMSAVEKSFSAS
jgi:hypothetical protein